LIDGPVDVVHHHIGGGEVDHHLGPGVGDGGQPVALIDHGHQFEILGGVDGPAHLGAHATPGAEHADSDGLRCLRIHTVNIRYPPAGEARTALVGMELPTYA